MSAKKKELTYCYSNFPLINEYKLLFESSMEAFMNAEVTKQYGYFHSLSDQMHALIPIICRKFRIKWADVCRFAFTYEDRTNLRHGILTENSSDALYFIKSGEFIKIGRTNDISRRMSEIQVSSPIKISLLGLFQGKGCYESRIHEFLDHIHVHGEWFSESEEIYQYIQKISSNNEKTAYAQP